jgi:hypothetical protein
VLFSVVLSRHLLCSVGFMTPFGVVARIRRQRLALSIGSN